MTLRTKARRLVRPRHIIARLTLLAGLLALSSGVLAGAATAASAASASSGVGWIRLAHLSPNTPAVDVYLYSFGDPTAMIVLKHVSYGTVSPYEKVKSGEYTVAMRGAGAPASSAPVLSTGFMVYAGDAYTVAGMGPKSGLRLKVLKDRLTTPKSKSLVRVIQASLREHHVTVTADGRTLANNLAFASVSSYGSATPGTWMVHASGGAEKWSGSVTLSADTIHTLVVLDGSGGALKVADLEDAAGSAVMPQGGAATGLGGTAPPPPSSPLPWLAAVAAGAMLTLAGAYRLRRVRAAARHAR
jgi:hypothetical protein